MAMLPAAPPAVAVVPPDLAPAAPAHIAPDPPDDRPIRAARTPCLVCGIVLTIVADGRQCPNCAVDCVLPTCDAPQHMRFRVAAAARIAAAAALAPVAPRICPAGNTRADIARRGDGTCPAPCPLRFTEHPMAPPRARDMDHEADAPPRHAAAAGYSATAFGVPPDIWPDHPINKTTAAHWAPLLAAITGRSVAELESIELISRISMTHTPARDRVSAILDGHASLSGHVMDAEHDANYALREVGGLLALQNTLAAHPEITVPAAALAENAVGRVSACEAVNDALVAKLEKRGRKYFLDMVLKISKDTADDPVQYVSGSTGTRTSRPWAVRFTLVQLACHEQMRTSRTPTWMPPLLMTLLTTPHVVQVVNTVIPVDGLPGFVQYGVLGTLEDARRRIPLGNASIAAQASLWASYAAFRRAHLETPSYTAVWKEHQLQLSRTSAPAPAPKTSAKAAAAALLAAQLATVPPPKVPPKPAPKPPAKVAGPNMTTWAAPGAGHVGGGQAATAAAGGPQPLSMNDVPPALRQLVPHNGLTSGAVFARCMNPACQAPPRAPHLPPIASRIPFCRRCAPALYPAGMQR